MLFEPNGVLSLPYSESKWNIYWLKQNPLLIHGKSPMDKSQYKKKSETNKSTLFSIQNLWKKVWCDFECPIHGIINSGKIEGAYFGRVRSMFLAKRLHNDFFWK